MVGENNTTFLPALVVNNNNKMINLYDDGEEERRNIKQLIKTEQSTELAEASWDFLH